MTSKRPTIPSLIIQRKVRVKQTKPRIWVGVIYSQAIRGQFYIGLIQLFLVSAAAIRHRFIQRPVNYY